MSGGEANASVRRVDPARKHGQVAGTWGNLLLPEGEMQLDDELVFEGEESGQHFWIARVNLYPLDRTKRLFYYQAHPRSKDSTMERPHTPTVQ